MFSFVDQFSLYIYIIGLRILAIMYSFNNLFRKLAIIDNIEKSNAKLENTCLVTILASLGPFLDSAEILCVRGRLKNSCLSINKKHHTIIRQNLILHVSIFAIFTKSFFTLSETFSQHF